MGKFYHCDRNPRLKQRQVLELQKYFDEMAKPGVNEVLDKIKLSYPEGISHHGKNYLLGPRDRDYHIEMTFEDIRKKEFSEKPSRFQSMFAWENINDARQFITTKCKGVIFELETDNFFIADQAYVGLGKTKSETEYFARQYWSGEKSLYYKLEVVIPLPIKLGMIIR